MYKQVLRKIEDLQSMVKEKDVELLYTPENPEEACRNRSVICFKKGLQKLQPASIQDTAKFTKAIKTLNRLTVKDFGKCNSTCDSYEKKTPKNFLKGFENLIQMNFTVLEQGNKHKFLFGSAKARKGAILVDKVPSNSECHSTIRQEDSPPLPVPRPKDNTDTMCKVLILGCIAAVILMTAPYGASLPTTILSPDKQKQFYLEVLLDDLKLLKDFDNDFLDFYTPNDKRECSHATLACFLKELDVVKKEVEEQDQQHVRNLQQNLERFMEELVQDPHFSDPTCKKCESHEKKNFAGFQREMISFLQSMKKQSV
ncbi:hypothetical protein TURU_163856 [Turdus rufiventris]|nr:hypothetical protein TURU_163856 [Turdus rufiventris]